MSSLNLNHLPTFVAVARCGSISVAARQLKLSQPAVSGQIAELERQLGQSLFDRLPRRGVDLTAAGEVFLSRITEALALIDDGELAMHDLEDLHSGQLTVGASSTTGTYLLPSAYGVFRQQHPRLSLSLRIDNSESILHMLREREVDFGIIEEEITADDCILSPWLTDEIVLICHARHPLVGSPPVKPHALWEHDFVHREAGSGTRQTVEAFCRDRDVDLPPGPAFGNIEALKRAVVAGVGMAWVSILAVQDELRRGELVVVRVRDLQIDRQHYLVHLRNRSLKPAAQALIELLHDCEYERSSSLTHQAS